MKSKIEINETPDGFVVIDIEHNRWLATFQMFDDARQFAEQKIKLKSDSIEVACGKCGWQGKQKELGGKFTVGGLLYCPHCRANFKPLSVTSGIR